MRQLVLEAPSALAWHDLPEPDIEGPGQALVRPLAVALCDLDHAIVTGEAPVPPPIHLGHECVAEVLEVGGEVTSVHAGDTVIVPFQISCGACATCAAGLTGSCASVEQLAMYGFGAFGHDWGGVLTDIVRVPYADAMLVAVPPDVEAAGIASMSDNIPDGLRLVLEPLRRHPGAEVLIHGGGTRSIALYAAGAAVALGAARVDYLDGDPARLALAADLGANAIEIEQTPYRADRSYPITVDGGSTAESVAFAARSTAPGGSCSSAGIVFAPTTPMPLLEMYTTGMSFHTGRAMARALIPEALALIRDRGWDPGRVTSRTVAWEDAPEAVLHQETKLVIAR
jgi:alcohol dehydrogenase